ncbi:GTP cyclohydrolase III [Conexivisphaera calida]|uniref:GTP cyclohydrolase III n=1 Tax=Conexivisphaera calida TaxID=1874277 RepID=A0A4P2VFY9_9ARCH|nr:GTP cyclohydrolase III [Conexivisphaera calida]
MRALEEREFDVVYMAATALLCAEKYEEALQLYEDAVRMMPGHAGAWHGLAICLDEVGRREEAKEAYESALKLYEERADSGEAHALLWGGWAALKVGELEVALDMFRRSIEVDPGYAYAWHSISIALARLGRREEAKEAKKRYLALLREKPYPRRECEGWEMLLKAREMAKESARGRLEILEELVQRHERDLGARCRRSGGTT